MKSYITPIIETVYLGSHDFMVNISDHTKAEKYDGSTPDISGFHGISADIERGSASDVVDANRSSLWDE